MGNSTSSHKDSHISTFSQAEQLALKKILDNVKHTTDLERNLPNIIPQRLRTALADLAAKKNTKDVTFEAFVDAVRILVFGSFEEKSAFISVYERQRNLTTRDFVTDIAAGIAIYLHHTVGSQSLQHAYQLSEKFINFLLKSCSSTKEDASDIFSTTTAGEITIPPLTDFLTFFPRSPYLQTLWTTLFQSSLLSIPPPPLPTLTPQSTLVTIEDMFIIHLSLPSDYKSIPQYPLLYSTATHGKSWTLFSSSIENAGSILLVIRSKSSHIFGAFIDTPLTPSPTFTGTATNFLFTLHPQISIFSPTGYNPNYQYYNHSTSTLPNGLGLGGQKDYFALFISEDFLHGHSHAAATYGSPMLTENEEFEIENVEAWLVKPREVDERLVDPREAKKSVLSDEVAGSLLEMGGRKMWSKEIGIIEKEKEEEVGE